MASSSNQQSSTIDEAFAKFCKFGDSKSDGKSITLTNADKWMKQAGVIGKKITTTDTGIAFQKFKVKQMNLKTFKEFVADLAKNKKMDVNDLMNLLSGCGEPGTSNATKADQSGAVDRLTDTSKYTGSHKERFDASGKGRGIEGRTNVDKNAEAGYVSGYKNKDTFDEKK